MRRVALTALLLLLPLAATAQVYTWKDASGKTHYSDRPPAEPMVQSRRLGPTATTDDAAASAAAADRRLDAAKRAGEDKDKAARAERERTEDARRQVACERARQNLQGIESGQIRYRMTAAGEREALDGAVRDAELAEARQAVEISCSPRPAAAKK